MSNSGNLKGLVSFRLSYAICRGTFSAFIPIFAGVYVGLRPTLIGILITTYTLIVSALQTYSGNIADRFNRKALVVTGGLVSIIFMVLIPSANSFRQLMLLCVIGGSGAAISTPAAAAKTVEEGRKFGMGSTMGIFAMAFSVGMAAGPLVSGVMHDIANINTVFYFGAGMLLIGISLFTWFTRE